MQTSQWAHQPTEEKDPNALRQEDHRCASRKEHKQCIPGDPPVSSIESDSMDSIMGIF